MSRNSNRFLSVFGSMIYENTGSDGDYEKRYVKQARICPGCPSRSVTVFIKYPFYGPNGHVALECENGLKGICTFHAEAYGRVINEGNITVPIKETRGNSVYKDAAEAIDQAINIWNDRFSRTFSDKQKQSTDDFLLGGASCCPKCGGKPVIKRKLLNRYIYTANVQCEECKSGPKFSVNYQTDTLLVRYCLIVKEAITCWKNYCYPFMVRKYIRRPCHGCGSTDIMEAKLPVPSDGLIPEDAKYKFTEYNIYCKKCGTRTLDFPYDLDDISEELVDDLRSRASKDWNSKHVYQEVRKWFDAKSQQ